MPGTGRPMGCFIYWSIISCPFCAAQNLRLPWILDSYSVATWSSKYNSLNLSLTLTYIAYNTISNSWVTISDILKIVAAIANRSLLKSLNKTFRFHASRAASMIFITVMFLVGAHWACVAGAVLRKNLENFVCFTANNDSNTCNVKQTS